MLATDAKSDESSEYALDRWNIADELDQVDGGPGLGKTDYLVVLRRFSA
jgi:hypothetical protein